jgi:parallel beta-helix repeat protein
MFSRNLGRSVFRSAQRAARRRRLKHVGRGPCAAEVLESRLLLSATLLVDPTSHNPAVFHTIQAAVNAAPSGSTIKVAPGTYNEDVTISKSLTLLGGQALTRGETGPSIVEYEATGFTVSSANKVTINGFTIEADPASTTSTDSAIAATNTASSTFENNVIVGSFISFGPGVTRTVVANNSDPSGSFFDIVVNGSTPGADASDTFLNNTLYNGGISLDVSATGALVQGNTATDGPQIINDADNVTVSHNVSDGADVGFIDIGNNSTYIDNTAENNDEGFSLTGGGKLTVTGNVANSNDGEGFFIAGNNTLTMRGNTANNNTTAGVLILGGSPTLIGDTANGNGQFGFELNATGGSTVVDSPSIIDCTANHGTGFGFEVATSGAATICGNTADGDVLGFGFSMAIGGGTVSDNTANSDSGFGISIASTGPLSVSGNLADNNGSTGMSLSMGSGTVSGNTANGNAEGGFVIGAGAASIEHNTADNNALFGFDLSLQGGTVSGNTALNNQGPGGAVDGFELSGSGNSISNNTARNNTGDGFVLNGLSQSTFSSNTSDNNGGDGIHLVGSGDNTLSHNTADNNGNDGFDLDVNSTANTLSNNTALGNKVYDLFDLSPGDGTAGTANTYTHNRAHTSDPPGLQ